MKYFTIEEAEACLPSVQKLVKKARRLRGKITWILETNEAVAEINTEAGFHYFVTEFVDVNKKFHKLYYQFYKTIGELQKIGVILKDVDEGLVDFPFKINEKDAFLCWQLGEDRIRHWHEFDCFDERKPVVDVDEFLVTD